MNYIIASIIFGPAILIGCLIAAAILVVVISAAVILPWCLLLAAFGHDRLLKKWYSLFGGKGL